jgi:chromosome segregation ATPase
MSDEKMTEAINGLNKEIRELRLRLTSATYRAEAAEERLRESEERLRDLREQLRAIPEDTRRLAAQLTESRRQVGVLVDSRRHINAVLALHGKVLRQVLADGGRVLPDDEGAVRALLGVILIKLDDLEVSP